MRCAEVYADRIAAGIIKETPDGFEFRYHKDYLSDRKLNSVSLSLPKRTKPYKSQILFPFFAGLLTEGITLQIQCRLLKIDPNDFFGRLLKTVHDDAIGNITIHELPQEES